MQYQSWRYYKAASNGRLELVSFKGRAKVSTKTESMDFPKQDVISRDNARITLDAILYISFIIAIVTPCPTPANDRQTVSYGGGCIVTKCLLKRRTPRNIAITIPTGVMAVGVLLVVSIALVVIVVVIGKKRKRGANQSEEGTQSPNGTPDPASPKVSRKKVEKQLPSSSVAPDLASSKVSRTTSAQEDLSSLHGMDSWMFNSDDVEVDIGENGETMIETMIEGSMYDVRYDQDDLDELET